MIKKLQFYWANHPWYCILGLAIVFRALAAIFSKGYGMHDDHFLVLELAQNWVNGSNEWFNQGPVIRRGLLYPGLHYLLFYGLESLGINDPQIKVLFTRVLHGAFSLITVIYGYKIAQLLTKDEKTLQRIGLLLAIFWVFPFMSVRNLLEMACIPPMAIGFYYAIKSHPEQNNFRHWFISGIMFGLALTIRFQVAFCLFGMGSFLLFTKRWKPLVAYSAGFLAAVTVTLGLVDYIAWGVPFSSFYNYILYNFSQRYSYIIGPWYRYLALLLGIFIPPVSFMILWGFGRSWKKVGAIFWPVFIFFVFHSYFPNKQERFILPIVPFVIILGVVGWRQFVSQSEYWLSKKKLRAGLWKWFWVTNTALLLLLTFTYSKKNRVETLYHLYPKTDVTGVIWESHLKSVPFIPRYYMDKDVPIYLFPASKTLDSLHQEITRPDASFPNYVIFLGQKKIDERVEKLQTAFSKKLVFEKRVTPSLIDNIAYLLNPRRNVNQVSYVYRIE